MINPNSNAIITWGVWLEEEEEEETGEKKKRKKGRRERKREAMEEWDEWSEEGRVRVRKGMIGFVIVGESCLRACGCGFGKKVREKDGDWRGEYVILSTWEETWFWGHFNYSVFFILLKCKLKLFFFYM